MQKYVNSNIGSYFEGSLKGQGSNCRIKLKKKPGEIAVENENQRDNSQQLHEEAFTLASQYRREGQIANRYAH